MGKEYRLEEALKLAIKAEKDSMDFYRKAAEATSKPEARRVFELLANEEVGHLKAFFDHYKGGEFGDLKSYMETPPDTNNPTYRSLLKAVDANTHEQKALEIALKEEKACIEQYTALAADIVDPLVKNIFGKVVEETRKHYELIEDEYMRVMGMVDRTDMDTYVRE